MKLVLLIWGVLTVLMMYSGAPRFFMKLLSSPIAMWKERGLKNTKLQRAWRRKRRMRFLAIGVTMLLIIVTFRFLVPLALGMPLFNFWIELVVIFGLVYVFGASAYASLEELGQELQLKDDVSEDPLDQGKD